jgi:hypothetical protein
MGEGCAAAATQARQQKLNAERRADLQTRVAHRGVNSLTVAYCVGGHQYHYSHSASQLGSVLPACAAGLRSEGGVWCRCSSNFSRAPPHANSDTGFELAVRNYPLWLEIQPSGPQLQRITRSPRSRPSLHGSASNHVIGHRACTRTHIRTSKLGCGTWSTHLGDSSQATAGQPRSCCWSYSDLKSATSQCYGGAQEAAGDAHCRRCIAVGMASHRPAWCAIFRMHPADCLRPRRQNRITEERLKGG